MISAAQGVMHFIFSFLKTVLNEQCSSICYGLVRLRNLVKYRKPYAMLRVRG